MIDIRIGRGFQQAEAQTGARARSCRGPWPSAHGWARSAPEWQADPPETATPFRSSAITSASPSSWSNQILVVLAARNSVAISGAVDAGSGNLQDSGFKPVAQRGQPVDRAIVEASAWPVPQPWPGQRCRAHSLCRRGGGARGCRPPAAAPSAFRGAQTWRPRPWVRASCAR